MMSSSSEFEDLASEKSLSLGVGTRSGCWQAEFDSVSAIIMRKWCRLCCCMNGGFRAGACLKTTYWFVGRRGEDAAGCCCGVTALQLAMRAGLVVDLALNVRTTSRGRSMAKNTSYSLACCFTRSTRLVTSDNER